MKYSQSTINSMFKYPRTPEERERFFESLLNNINRTLISPEGRRSEEDYLRQNTKNVIQVMLEFLPKDINLNTVTVKPTDVGIIVNQGEVILREWRQYDQTITCYFEETPTMALTDADYSTLTEGLKAPKEQSFWKRSVKINR